MTFFVRVADPKQLRKTLLEAAKDTILYQYAYEEFLQLRQEKAEVLKQIKSDLSELLNLLGEIDEVLEGKDLDVDLPELFDESDEDSEQESTESLTDVDRLEYTLKRIESTLESL